MNKVPTEFYRHVNVFGADAWEGRAWQELFAYAVALEEQLRAMTGAERIAHDECERLAGELAEAEAALKAAETAGVDWRRWGKLLVRAEDENRKLRQDLERVDNELLAEIAAKKDAVEAADTMRSILDVAQAELAEASEYNSARWSLEADTDVATPTEKPLMRGEWLVGLYEDEDDLAFIGVVGGNTCWVDNLTKAQAEALCRLHNATLEQLRAMTAAERVVHADRDRLEGEWYGASERYKKNLGELRDENRKLRQDLEKLGEELADMTADRDGVVETAALFHRERDEARAALLLAERKADWFVAVARGLLRLARAQRAMFRWNAQSATRRLSLLEGVDAALAALDPGVRKLVEL